MDGTRKFTLLVAACVTAVSVFAWWRRPEPSSILDMEPIDGERAVVVRRDARAGSPVAYVQLVERSGIRWEQELRGASFFPDPSHRLSRIADASGTVLLRSIVRDAPALDGLDAASGRPRWHLAPMPNETDRGGTAFNVLNLSLVTEGRTAIAFYGRELTGGENDFVRLLAVDALTGAVQWEQEIRGEAGLSGPAWVRGESLVLFAGSALVVLDLRTGRTRARFEADPVPCVTASQAWFTWGGELHVLALEGLSERTVPKPIEAPLQLTGACAMRGGSLWVAASDRYGQTRADGGRVAAFAPMWMLALDPTDASLRAQLDLGRVRGGTHGDDRGRDSAPDAMPLSGDAPRYVPLTVRDAEHPPYVVMLDLDSRRIAWQTPPDDRFTYSEWHRGGTRHYLAETRSRLFAALDGGTGLLTGAVTMPPLEVPRTAGERVWIHDRSNVASVDPRTLAVLWSTGPLPLPDARADAEKLFAQGSR